MNKTYVPLYRKYRPQKLEEIVGQEHIKKALTNAIDMKRISHAYLFTGPRGTGKTSTARIFAKSLNCENGPTISPCNECENCRNITNSIPIDVIEIDAASNRSVSDAEEIIQNVAMAPINSRYKIYIIDEVHMLTPTAFNALLKTLEEPPENVIFILATTEVHKVLDTIKSRCQRFDFKRITTSDIAKHLRYVSDKEGINITDEALYYIAQNSAGGMRDSIALLDQLSVLNSSKEAIGVDDINRLLGRLSFDVLDKLFAQIVSSNGNSALEVLNDIYNQGNDPVQILSNFLEYLRNALIAKSVEGGNLQSSLQLNEGQIQVLSKSVEDIETHQLVSLVDKCAGYIKELKNTSNPKLWLDVAVLDMANLAQNTKLEDLQKRIAALESGSVQKPVNVSAYNTPPSPVMKKVVQKPIELKSESASMQEKVPTTSQEIKNNNLEPEIKTTQRVQNQTDTASSGGGADIRALWADFLERVPSFPSRVILQQQGLPVKITPEEIIIAIKNSNWLKSFGQDGERFEFLQKASESMFGNVSKIIVREPQANDNKIQEQAPAVSVQPKKKVETQTKEPTSLEEEEGQAELEKEEKNSVTEEEIFQKPVVNNLDASYHSDNVNMAMDLFEGKIIE